MMKRDTRWAFVAAIASFASSGLSAMLVVNANAPQAIVPCLISMAAALLTFEGWLKSNRG